MEDDGRGCCCCCCCCGDDDPAEAVTIFNSAPMLACTFDNRFGNSLANRPKVPSTVIVSSNLICEIVVVVFVVVVFVAHTLLLLLCLVPMLWLLMLSNDNGVGRLFFALGVEAIAPAVVATTEVEVAEEEDDNNKD